MQGIIQIRSIVKTRHYIIASPVLILLYYILPLICICHYMKLPSNFKHFQLKIYTFHSHISALMSLGH